MSLDVGRVVVARLTMLVAAGELLYDELVVRHVGLERVDPPVAIPPGVADGTIALESAGLAVSHQVEPVPRPALAIARIFEQLIDELRVGVRRRVIEKRLNL